MVTRKTTLLVFFCGIVLFGFSQNGKQFVLKNTTKLETYTGNTYARFELSKEEIRIADSLVAKYVVDKYRHYDWTKKITNYSAYYRQYAGYKAGSPGRIVFINAYYRKPDVTDQYMEENLVQYKGGGSGFFNIKVNLETNACFDLRVNASK